MYEMVTEAITREIVCAEWCEKCKNCAGVYKDDFTVESGRTISVPTVCPTCKHKMYYKEEAW